MSALETILGAYAPGHVLSHRGRDYCFPRIDKRTQAALTVAYFKRAREAIYELRGEISDAEFDRQLSVVTADYRRGRYSFPLGESFNYYVLGEGIAELVERLTGCTADEAEALVSERTIETLHVVTCVVAESSAQLKKTILAQREDGPIGALLTLLSPATSSNGSPSGNGTPRPPSPAPASAPTCSPA